MAMVPPPAAPSVVSIPPTAPSVVSVASSVDFDVGSQYDGIYPLVDLLGMGGSTSVGRSRSSSPAPSHASILMEWPANPYEDPTAVGIDLLAYDARDHSSSHSTPVDSDEVLLERRARGHNKMPTAVAPQLAPLPEADLN